MSSIYDFTPLWGNWNIEKKIGEGSFGKVYLASHTELGQTFYSAIKHISIPQDESHIDGLYAEGLAQDVQSVHDYFAQVAEELLKEIQLMYELRGNTNIVAYEDHMVREKTISPGYDVIIRMEHLKSLETFMRERELKEADVIQLGVDICSALERLAAMKLVHRDIKPANLFINAAGDFKLGDFGVTYTMERSATVMSRKGTYSYMAPEVYKGQIADARSDLYSLGLVLYRLMNGNRAPFLQATEKQINFHANEEAFFRRLRGEDLPAPAFATQGTAEIILKACAFAPAARFESASDMKAALLWNAKRKTEPYFYVEETVSVPVERLSTWPNGAGDRFEPFIGEERKETPANIRGAGYDFRSASTLLGTDELEEKGRRKPDAQSYTGSGSKIGWIMTGTLFAILAVVCLIAVPRLWGQRKVEDVQITPVSSAFVDPTTSPVPKELVEVLMLQPGESYKINLQDFGIVGQEANDYRWISGDPQRVSVEKGIVRVGNYLCLESRKTIELKGIGTAYDPTLVYRVTVDPTQWYYTQYSANKHKFRTGETHILEMQPVVRNCYGITIHVIQKRLSGTPFSCPWKIIIKEDGKAWRNARSYEAKGNTAQSITAFFEEAYDLQSFAIVPERELPGKWTTEDEIRVTHLLFEPHRTENEKLQFLKHVAECSHE